MHRLDLAIEKFPSLHYPIRIKKNDILCSACSYTATVWSFVRRPLFVDVFFTASAKPLRNLSRRPSPLWFIIRLSKLSLLNLNFLKVFVVAVEGFTTKTQHSRTRELPFEKTWLSLVMFFELIITSSGKKRPLASAVRQAVRSFEPNRSHSALIAGPIQFSSSFSARATYGESVSISFSSKLFTSQNLVEKIVVEFPQTMFCVLKNGKSYNDW